MRHGELFLALQHAGIAWTRGDLGVVSRCPLGLSRAEMTLSVLVVSHHSLSLQTFRSTSPAYLPSDPFSLKIRRGPCRECPALQRFPECLWWVMRQNLMKVAVHSPPLGTYCDTERKGSLAADQSKSSLWPCRVPSPRIRYTGLGTWSRLRELCNSVAGKSPLDRHQEAEV